MQTFSINYGADGRVDLKIDPRRIDLHHRAPAPCGDLPRRLHTALETPLDFPSLTQICVPGDRVVVALDRNTPGSAEIVAAIWEMLDLRGVSPDEILILQPVALDGVKLADPRQLLPDSVRSAIPWKIHDPTDSRRHAYLASTARGERIYLARELVEADVVISAGTLAYDAVLGYRGTNSVFYPGLSNTEAITRTRGEGHAELNPDDERPLRQSIDEIAWLLGTQFSIQVIPAAGVGVSEVIAGAYDSVFRKGKRRLQQLWGVNLAQRAEIVIAAVDVDSAGHGWSQIGAALAAAKKLVEKGGKIILFSQLAIEQEMGIEIIRKSESARAALAPIRKNAPVDMLPATQFAMAADWAKVYFLGRMPTGIIEELFMTPLDRDIEAQRLLEGTETCVILESAQHVYGAVAG